MAFPALPPKPGKSALETRLATYVILLSFFNIFNNFSQKRGGGGVGWVGAILCCFAWSPVVQKSREKKQTAQVGVTHLTRSCAIQWVSRSTLSARKKNRKGINTFPFTSVSHVSGKKLREKSKEKKTKICLANINGLFKHQDALNASQSTWGQKYSVSALGTLRADEDLA